MTASRASGSGPFERRGPRRAGRVGAEDGFTLVELLVAMMVGLVVIGAGVAAFTTGVRSEPRISERAFAIQQARTTIERISRELRQGLEVREATPSSLEVLTYVPRATCGGAETGAARKCTVTYTCSAGSCTRTEVDPDAPGTPVPVNVVSGLASDAVFTYGAGDGGVTSYVGIRLEFPTREGDDAITLEDGVSLRNPETTQGG